MHVIINKLTMRSYFNIVIISLLLLCLGISCILFSSQTNTTTINNSLNSGQPLKFSDLNFSIHNQTISFPSGGYIVPVYRQHHLIGCALFGEGTLAAQNSTTMNECYILLNETMYRQILNNLYLQTSSEQTFSQRALEFAKASQKFEHVILSPSGYKFLSLPNDYLKIVLFQNNTTTFKPQHVYTSKSLSLNSKKPIILICMGYAFIYFSLIGIVIILSSHFSYKHAPYDFYLAKPSLQDYKWHLLILILVWMLLRYGIKNVLLTATYQVLSITFLLYIAKKKNVPLSLLRSDLTVNIRSIPLGILSGLLFYLCSNPELPQNINQLLPWLQFSLLNTLIPVTWGIIIAYGFILYELERELPYSYALGGLLIALSLVFSFNAILFNHMGTFMLGLNTLIYQPLLCFLIFLLIRRTNSLMTGIVSLSLALSLTSFFI